MRNPGRASLVCRGVTLAPHRGDVPVMAAAVFPLDEVAHGVGARTETATTRDCSVCMVEDRGQSRDGVEPVEKVIR